MWKNGQAKPLEEQTETIVRQLCLKWYKKGFRAGKREAEKKLHPDVHYCKECKWLCGEVKSVGIRCMNQNRRRNPSPTSDFRAPSSRACKTGYEPKEDDT